LKVDIGPIMARGHSMLQRFLSDGEQRAIESVMSDSETVELGVDLLGALDDGELSLAELLDRIETLTTSPTTTRSILDTAERRGVIHRENGVVRTTTGSGINLQHDV